MDEHRLKCFVAVYEQGSVSAAATRLHMTQPPLSMLLRKLEGEALVRTGVLSAAFFAASLVHLPLGPASVHLVLSGLMGALLGWGAGWWGGMAIWVGLLLTVAVIYLIMTGCIALALKFIEHRTRIV